MARLSARTRLPVIVAGLATVLSVAAAGPLPAQTAPAQDDATLVLPRVYDAPEVISMPPTGGNAGSEAKPCNGDAIQCTPDPLAENAPSWADRDPLAASGDRDLNGDVGTLQDYQQELAGAGAGLVTIAPGPVSSAGIAPLSIPPPLVVFSTGPDLISPPNPSAVPRSYGASAGPLVAAPVNSLTMTPGTAPGLSPFEAGSGMMFMPGP